MICQILHLVRWIIDWKTAFRFGGFQDCLAECWMRPTIFQVSNGYHFSDGNYNARSQLETISLFHLLVRNEFSIDHWTPEYLVQLEDHKSNLRARLQSWFSSFTGHFSLHLHRMFRFTALQFTAWKIIIFGDHLPWLCGFNSYEAYSALPWLCDLSCCKVYLEINYLDSAVLTANTLPLFWLCGLNCYKVYLEINYLDSAVLTATRWLTCSFLFFLFSFSPTSLEQPAHRQRGLAKGRPLPVSPVPTSPSVQRYRFGCPTCNRHSATSICDHHRLDRLRVPRIHHHVRPYTAVRRHQHAWVYWQSPTTLPTSTHCRCCIACNIHTTQVRQSRPTAVFWW